MEKEAAKVKTKIKPRNPKPDRLKAKAIKWKKKLQV